MSVLLSSATCCQTGLTGFFFCGRSDNLKAKQAARVERLHFALPGTVSDCFPSLPERVNTQKSSALLPFKRCIALLSCSAFTIEAFFLLTQHVIIVIVTVQNKSCPFQHPLQ